MFFFTSTWGYSVRLFYFIVLVSLFFSSSVVRSQTRLPQQVVSVLDITTVEGVVKKDTILLDAPLDVLLGKKGAVLWTNDGVRYEIDSVSSPDRRRLWATRSAPKKGRVGYGVVLTEIKRFGGRIVAAHISTDPNLVGLVPALESYYKLTIPHHVVRADTVSTGGISKQAIAKALGASLDTVTGTLVFKDTVKLSAGTLNTDAMLLKKNHLLIGDAKHRASMLAPGMVGRVLGVDNSNNVAWISPGSVSPAIGRADTLNNLRNLPYLTYFSSKGYLDTSKVYFDTVNHRVGIGTDTPSERLDVLGGALVDSIRFRNAVNIVSGASTDSILTVNANGVVRRRSSASLTTSNIYTTDGTLTGNRVVTQGSNRLSFTGSVANMFNVGTNNLSVDGLNNRVGIGTDTPSERLDVLGGALVDSIRFRNASNIARGASTDSILTVDTSGVVRRRSSASLATSNIYTTDGTLTGNRVVSQGSNRLSFTGSVVNMFNVGSNSLSVDGLNNRVGIGTDTPSERLDVLGGALVDSIRFRNASNIASGTSTDSILTVNANGKVRRRSSASLATSNIYTASGTLTGNRVVSQGGNILSFTGGRVGIGTTAPVAGGLHINIGGGTSALASWLSNSPLAITSNGAPGSLNRVYFENLSSNAGSRVFMLDNEGGVFGFHSTSDDANAFTNSNILTLIHSSGRVGIGTASPVAKLQVAGRTITDSLTVSNLGDGLSGDSVLTSDASGVVRRRSLRALAKDTLLSKTLARDTTFSKTLVRDTAFVKTLARDTTFIKTLVNDTSFGKNMTRDTVFAKTLARDTINIYTADGTLTGNRVVTQGSNRLSFTGSVANMFNVGTNNLSVDGFNNRVGIGTASPVAKLQVTGRTITDSLTIANVTSASSADSILTVDGSGKINWISRASLLGVKKSAPLPTSGMLLWAYVPVGVNQLRDSVSKSLLATSGSVDYSGTELGIQNSYIDFNNAYATIPAQSTIRTMVVLVKYDQPSSFEKSFLLSGSTTSSFHSGYNTSAVIDPSDGGVSARGGLSDYYNNKFLSGDVSAQARERAWRIVIIRTGANSLANYIGNDRNTTGRTGDFKLAEMVLYNRELSDAEVLQTAQYLDGKYRVSGIATDVSVLVQGGNTFGSPVLVGSKDVQGLGLLTQGQERLVVDTVGRVGIGTASPLAKLDVSGAALVDSIRFRNANNIRNATNTDYVLTVNGSGKVNRMSRTDLLGAPPVDSNTTLPLSGMLSWAYVPVGVNQLRDSVSKSLLATSGSVDYSGTELGIQNRYIDFNNAYATIPAQSIIRTMVALVKYDQPGSFEKSFLLGGSTISSFHSGYINGSTAIIDPSDGFVSARGGLSDYYNNRFLSGDVSAQARERAWRIVIIRTGANSLANYIGNDRNTSGRTGDFKLAEMVLYNRELSDAEVLQAAQYLDGKYRVSGIATDVSVLVQGGNTFGSPVLVGSKDVQALGLLTQGHERLVVDAVGRVGIGTASPTAKLQVAGRTTTDSLTIAHITSGSMADSILTIDRLGKVNRVSRASFLGVGKSVPLPTAGMLLWAYVPAEKNELLDGVSKTSLGTVGTIDYSGTELGKQNRYVDFYNGYATIPAQSTIRTMVALVKYDQPSSTDRSFLLGESGSFDFHSGHYNGSTAIIDPNHPSVSARGGLSDYYNDKFLSGDVSAQARENAWRIVIIRTGSNCRANYIGNDRNITGRTGDFKLAEMVLYNRELSDAEVLQAAQYLDGKYRVAGIATDVSVLTQGGNTFGSPVLVGSRDAQRLGLLTQGQERVVVDTMGRVGIGTLSPAAKLHVAGEALVDRLRFTNSSIAIGNSTSTQGSNNVIIGNGTGTNLDYLSAYNVIIGSETATQPAISTGNTIIGARLDVPRNMSTSLAIGGGATSYRKGEVWIFANSVGNVCIGGIMDPRSKLDVRGQVTADGFNTGSDIRYKKDIAPISNALSKALQLRGVYYRWRKEAFPDDKNFDTRRSIGFIAQDVEKVIPELVSTDKKGYKSMSYGNVTALLIEAMKEQNTTIEQQQEEIKQMKKTLDEQQQENRETKEELRDLKIKMLEVLKKLDIDKTNK